MANRLGLAGANWAGKSTVARYLSGNAGYIHASVSGYLMHALAELHAIDVSVVQQNKEVYRPSLQDLGDYYGLNDPDRSIDVLIRVLDFYGALAQPMHPVVLEAIRGEVQAKAAQGLGFTIVHLQISEEEQENRAPDIVSLAQMRAAALARPDLESGYPDAPVVLNASLSTDRIAQFIMTLPDRGLYNNAQHANYQDIVNSPETFFGYPGTTEDRQHAL